jgi:hypothetical protein
LILIFHRGVNSVENEDQDCIDTARGIEYVHNYAVPLIIH